MTHAGARGVLSCAPNPTTGVDYSSVTGMSIETSNGLRFYANGGAYISDMGNVSLLPKSTYFDSMTGIQGASFLNGANTSNNVPNFTQGTCTGFILGARWGGSGSPGIDSYGNIIINEIIVYSNAITVAQRQAVEAYLSVKWGTGALLASSNIYNQKTSNSFGLASAVPIPVTRPAQNAKWLPTRIASLQLWLDAADQNSMTLSGTSLTQWNDKSGLGNNVLNSYISGTLTYGTNNISSGSSSYFYAPVDSRRSTASNLQVFIIYRWLNSTAGTNQGLWGDDDGGWNRLQLLSFPATSQDAYGLSLGAANAANVATTTNTSNILGTSNTIIYHASYNGYTTNGSFVFLNGTTAATFTDTAPSPQTSLTNTWFSAIGPNNDLPSQIRFSEILMYNTTLTDAQRQQLEGYFAWKWGLKTSLPAGHPFSLLAPLPMP